MPHPTRASIRPLLVSVSLLLSVAACDNPATKDKPKAQVGEPQATAPAAATKGAAETFPFGAKDSKIGFVGAKVTGKHDGSFGGFHGTVTLIDKDPTKSAVDVEITTASLTSDQEKLTGHLKSADFFDVEKFPRASFKSTTIAAGASNGATHTVTGNLELHGVTKAVTFPATIKVKGDGVDVDAEFAINRKDFGLAYPGKVDDLIRDDVLIKLAIRATKSAT